MDMLCAYPNSSMHCTHFSNKTCNNRAAHLSVALLELAVSLTKMSEVPPTPGSLLLTLVSIQLKTSVLTQQAPCRVQSSTPAKKLKEGKPKDAKGCKGLKETSSKLDFCKKECSPIVTLVGAAPKLYWHCQHERLWDLQTSHWINYLSLLATKTPWCIPPNFSWHNISSCENQNWMIPLPSSVPQLGLFDPYPLATESRIFWSRLMFNPPAALCQ